MAKYKSENNGSQLCLIASYGGSGSTFLAAKLKELYPDLYHYDHVHGVPSPNFLGIPVFNQYTGHNEGPFSKDLELPASSKVIVIFRDPKEAYLSRACYKHFMHLWSDTDIMEEVFGEQEPNIDTFNRHWNECKKSNTDVMRLSEYRERWRDYSRLGKHDIFFVKYEELEASWKHLLEFLEIPDDRSSKLENFNAAKREVPEDVKGIFEQLGGEYRNDPSFEKFPSTKEHVTSKGYPKISLPNGYFTCLNPGAGASDAISRIGGAYDVIQSCFSSDFYLSSYENYHSPDVDWLDIFGLHEKFVSLDKNRIDIKTVEISLSKLIYYVMHDQSFFKDGVGYHIAPDIYPNDFRISRLRAIYPSPRNFFDGLKYRPSSNPFTVGTSSVKAVLHLRRQDIAGSELFTDLDRQSLPKHLWRDIQCRELLGVPEALHALEGLTGQNRNIEVVIASDGFDALKKRFANYPHILERIEKLMSELQAPLASDQNEIRVVDRVIGTGAHETRLTLDAMFHADYIITASSSFPNIVARLGKAKLIDVFVARNR